MTLLLMMAINVWSTAVALKAAKALVSDSEYRFRQWDGGTTLKGKTLTGAATWVKLMVNVVVAFGIVAMFAGLLPVPIKWVVVAVGGIGIVSDYVNARRAQTTPPSGSST
jgi:hypothetical protein